MHDKGDKLSEKGTGQGVSTKSRVKFTVEETFRRDRIG